MAETLYDDETLNIENNNNQLSVKVYVADPLVETVSVPVWTDTNGQDDLIWHNAVALGDGWWSVKIDMGSHGYAADYYNLHIYGRYADGTQLFQTGTRIWAESVLTGDASIVYKDDDYGKFRIQIDNVCAPFDINKVMVPVWSNVNGQDDIIWYTAYASGNSWFVDVDALNHGLNTGIYSAHVYYYGTQGERVCISALTTEVFTNALGNKILEYSFVEADGILSIVLKNYVVEGTVRIPTWTTANGQDDLIWYTAERVDAYTWKLDVPLSAHHYENGVYNFHAYALNGNQLEFLAGSKADIQFTQPEPAVIVETLDDKTGDYRIWVEGVFFGGNVDTVRIPIWSQKDGQDDLVWYTAERVSAYRWKLELHLSNHDYESGIYHMHVYVTNDEGTRCPIGTSKELQCERIAPKVSIEAIDAQYGQYRVWLKDGYIDKDITSIYMPTWTEKNGQDDIVWYSAKKSGDAWYADIDAKNHRYEDGLYIVHCYASMDGAMQFMGNSSQDIVVEVITDGGLSNAVTASSWIVYDQNNDKVIYAKNPDGVVQLASQTKLMTAMLVLEHVSDLNASVTMTYSANSGMTWDTTRAGLVVGQNYTVRTLLEGLLVYSGGDCANLLAEYVAGSVPAFVTLMNEKAAELGMQSTYFSDPIGLYDNHSTPRQYMKLASWADDNATLRSITAMPSCRVATVNGTYVRVLSSTNMLLTGRVPYNGSAYIVDGLKTGFTDSAGYCQTTSGYDSKYRYIVAAFNCRGYTQRAVDCRTLLDSVLIY